MIKTKIGSVRDPVERFFAYAVEREAIRIRREVHQQPAPYTDDPILGKYRFCNVRREDDRTTRWFKQYVREPLRAKPEVLLATVLFRWFNRITTGKAMFCQESIYRDGTGTAWEEYLRCRKTSVLLHAIKGVCGKGPYITGSYIVLGKRGLPKLQGCLWGVDQFNKLASCTFETQYETQLAWTQVADTLLSKKSLQSQERLWRWLRQFPYLGDFSSYEIVTDLRHTALLENATDVMTWANPGPGAARGLNRIFKRELKHSLPRELLIKEIQLLLNMSGVYWPTVIEGVRTSHWEMREVEHQLCELDKYERVRLGEGRPRQVFRC